MASRPIPALLVILLVAVATRWVTYGNPVVILDDQFYLLVGDAIRHGQWPYIDIWDRKPIGLFLLFAGIAAIGNGSILVMQIIATLFAAATALVIRQIARLFVGPVPALLAAIVYLVAIPSLSGQTGQSPVFYNLFVGTAGWLLLSAAAMPNAAIERKALLAMLLCGISIMIKPVAVFEGAAFGLSFLYLLRIRGVSHRRLAVTALAMIATALLPVVAPLLAYSLAGEEARHAYVYANFISIFQKESFGLVAKSAGFAYFILYCLPLLVLAALGMREAWRNRRASPLTILLATWLVAAFLGYLSVPLFFDHYALPLFVPLCVAAALAFAGRAGPLYAAAVVVFYLIQGPILDLGGNREARRLYDVIDRRIDEARHGGCIYLADGPTWFYQSTGACRLTPYLFPQHLNLHVERRAVGIDPLTELTRVLAQRPAVIVTQDNEQKNHSPVTQPILRETLTRDYRVVGLVPEDGPPLLATLRVWQRRDLAPPTR